MIVTLCLLPGNGLSDITVRTGATLQDIANMSQCQGRQLILNGETIPASQYGSRQLRGGDEIGALRASKGNG